MKFVIWGAGQRGKKALEIFGKEKTLCFVDEDKGKKGKFIKGVEIKDVDYIGKICEPFVILITPVDEGSQIAEKLEEKKMYNYLLLEEHPVGIDLSANISIMNYIQTVPSINSKVILYGINWFNIFLYDCFSTRGINVFLFLTEKKQENIAKEIDNEYRIICNRQQLMEADYVFAQEEISMVRKEKIINIEDYIERTYPINNLQIAKYKNIHKGKRCFIIATGPSLRISDLDSLNKNNEICISMNRIYQLFGKTKWRPDYYVVEDKKMIEDLAEDIAQLDLKHKFINGAVDKYWKIENTNNSISYKMVMQSCLSDAIGFSRHLERIIYNGYTVTYVCLQLAIYMGFSQIYLVGVDFNYLSDIYAETNHFEGYQNHYKDIRLNPIKPERMIRAYSKARKVAEMLGVQIYNATRGGKLEVFERLNLDKLLEENT